MAAPGDLLDIPVGEEPLHGQNASPNMIGFLSIKGREKHRGGSGTEGVDGGGGTEEDGERKTGR